VAAACGGSDGPAAIPPVAIDYVDGAVEPIVVRGATVVIGGYGFGTTQGGGGVTFTSATGSVAAIVVDSGWSDFAVTVVVPDGAVTGSLALTTDAGQRLERAVHVLPVVPFDVGALAWQARAGFPRAPVGVAVSAAEFADATGIVTTIFAVGGAEPVGGDSVFAPETSVHVAQAQSGGVLTAWVRQSESADAAANRSLPAPRAFAAAVVATRNNARLPLTTGVLYVIGGIDTAGRAQNTVFGADVSPAGVVGRFASLSPLPIAVAGAAAVVRRGSIYLIGGADADGQPLETVLVARVTPSGQLDGWYHQPSIPGSRAYAGAAVLDRRALAFGGMDATVVPGGGLDDLPPRLDSGDSNSVSRRSGFFVGGWGVTGTMLPQPRSQFAVLNVGTALLVVGGMYPGAATNDAETVAAPYVADSLGTFTGPVGVAAISDQGGGTLVGPAGATWRETGGTVHGLVLGGMDLATRLRRTGVWGF